MIDRLSLHPRPGRAPARLPWGVEGIDARIGGGLVVPALHEFRAAQARDIGAATGVLIGLLTALMRTAGKRLLWVSDPAAVADAGLLYPDGLAQFGLDPAVITQVFPVDVKTALWAADEGARCPDLAAVVLQIKGNPARLDRLATRRLMLRSQASGVMVLILRQSGVEEAGAAQTRWRIAPRPARAEPGLTGCVGWPHVTLVLERCRSGQTGAWALQWDPKRKVFDHGQSLEEDAPVSVDRPAASVDRSDRAAALGQILDLRRAP
ncbi:MAG: hypothetical protein AAGE76_02420 [Pseudomonadota bacterium]